MAFACTALLCAGFLTVSEVPGWAPRMAAVLLALPIGLAALVVGVRRRDPAAIALAAGLGWCLAVSFFHTAPPLRLFGMIGQEASVLIYVGAAACWAIGRTLDDTGRRLLPWVVLGATAVSAVFGLLQVVFQTESGALVLDDGRAHGLTTYSIYFGSLASGAVVLLAALELPRRRWAAQLVAVFGFAVASGLSGSRAALGAAVLGVIYLIVRRHDVVAFGSAVLLALGSVVASLLIDHFAGGSASAANTGVAPSPVPASDGGSSLQRLGGSGGLSWRVDAWRAGLDAWADRPITGWGVGNFRQAVQADVGPGFEQLAPRFDSHNIVIELLTTIGLPGLVMFAAFGLLCARQARGPLALAAVTLAWSWLLQPAGLSTLPLALLLAGGAMPRLQIEPATTPARARRWVDLTVAAGLVAMVALLAVDLRFSRAVEAADPRALESLGAAYPFDPTFADAVAQAWMIDLGGLYGAEEATDAQLEYATDRVLLWSQRAIDRQPDAPRWYDAMALRLAQLGRYDDARHLLDLALELQPRRSESQQLLDQIEAADRRVTADT